MQKTLSLTLLGLFTLILSGCLSTGLNSQAVSPGAPVGLSTPTTAQLLEPLKGGLIGGSLGETLTLADKQRGLVAEYQALETSFGQAPIVWENERKNVSGEVIAGAPYRVGQQDCRPYSHKLTQKEVVTAASGSACRQSNGSWLRLQ